MRILLAVDGSVYSDAAIDEVMERTWPAGSEVKVISAVEPAYLPAAEPWAIAPTYYGELDRAAQERARDAVDSAAKKLADRPEKVLLVTTDTPTGSPKQVILDEAEAWGADLVVLGSHGYGAWNRILLGSVSNAVATHAKCCVEIVRRPHTNGNGHVKKVA
ncbi:MAG: universal stress protein [Pyrinomonadaceae bacterium]